MLWRTQIDRPGKEWGFELSSRIAAPELRLCWYFDHAAKQGWNRISSKPHPEIPPDVAQEAVDELLRVLKRPGR